MIFRLRDLLIGQRTQIINAFASRPVNRVEHARVPGQIM